MEINYGSNWWPLGTLGMKRKQIKMNKRWGNFITYHICRGIILLYNSLSKEIEGIMGNEFSLWIVYFFEEWRGIHHHSFGQLEHVYVVRVGPIILKAVQKLA